MATYTDAGTGIWESLASDDHQAYVDDMIDEAHFQDAREDVIYRFYEGKLSYKAAEVMAIIWAKRFQEWEWNCEEVLKVARIMDLDWKESHLILGQRDEYFKKMKDNQFWRQPDCNFDDTRDDVRGWDL